MSLTAVDLCARALLKIGANRISSFAETTLEAEVATNLYPTVRDALLSAHPWNFATTQQKLVQSATPPIADHENAFDLPEDCIRVLSAGTNDRGHGLTYRIQQRRLLTNADDIVLTYVTRPLEADFPPFFDSTLIAHLAAEFCIPLTDSTSRWEALQKAADHELRRARLIDAQEETAPHLDDFTLTSWRY
ncbi:MAG: hypothetical protein U1E42_00420 [Rhodospirillales bacterium]